MFLDNRLSDPPPFSQLPSKGIPDALPAHYPAAGKSFPRAKEVGGSDGNCTDGNDSFLPRYTVAGRRRWRWLYFSSCFSPRPLPFLAPPSRRRWTQQLRFYPVLGACALKPPQPLVGVEWHPNRVHPAPEARLGGGGGEEERIGQRWFWEWEKVLAGREGGSFQGLQSLSFHPVVSRPSSPISRLKGYSGKGDKEPIPSNTETFPNLRWIVECICCEIDGDSVDRSASSWLSSSLRGEATAGGSP